MVRVRLKYATVPFYRMDSDERDTVVCEACGERFDTERALRRHVRGIGLLD